MNVHDDARTVAEKFRAAEEKVARTHGDFFLFGLFERTPDRWEIVASAPWLENSLEERRS